MLLVETREAYRQGCNSVSAHVDATHCFQQALLSTLANPVGLRFPMAQSVIKTVISRYKSVLAHGHPWTQVEFATPALDLVWNRVYSLKVGQIFVNTLAGRVPVSFARHGMEKFFDGTGPFGTAHLVHRHDRWFFHVPRTKDVTNGEEIRQVVELDFGINFVVTAYDSPEQTTFFPGRAVKAWRAPFKCPLRPTAPETLGPHEKTVG